MRYTTKIELPVGKPKQGNYVLSENALTSTLVEISTKCDVVDIEWKEDNCVVTIEMTPPIDDELRPSSFDQFVREIVRQNSRQNQY